MPFLNYICLLLILIKYFIMLYFAMFMLALVDTCLMLKYLLTLMIWLSPLVIGLVTIGHLDKL